MRNKQNHHDRDNHCPPDSADRVGIGVGLFLAYLIVSPLYIAYSGVTETGPARWIIPWEIHHLGFDSFLINCLPGTAIWLASVFSVIMILTWLRPPISPSTEVPDTGDFNTPAAEANASKINRILLVIGLVCILGGLASFFYLKKNAPRDAGKPLPELTVAEVTAPGAKLPQFAHIANAVGHPDLILSRDVSSKYKTVPHNYNPLTTPGWQSGDKISLVEEFPEGFDINGPREGELKRNAIPFGLLIVMQEAGWPIDDQAIVLSRQNLLGFVPEPDLAGADFGLYVCLVLGVMFSLPTLGSKLNKYKSRNNSSG